MRALGLQAFLLAIALLIFPWASCGHAAEVELGEPCEEEALEVCSMEAPGVVEEPFPAVIDCYGGRWALAEVCLEVCHWRPEEGRAWCDDAEPPEGL